MKFFRYITGLDYVFGARRRKLFLLRGFYVLQSIRAASEALGLSFLNICVYFEARYYLLYSFTIIFMIESISYCLNMSSVSWTSFFFLLCIERVVSKNRFHIFQLPYSTMKSSDVHLPKHSIIGLELLPGLATLYCLFMYFTNLL